VHQRTGRLAGALLNAALHPALAEAAHRAGADAIGLVDLGGASESEAAIDAVGVTYGTGQVLGDPSAAVQVASDVVGDRPLPDRPLPRIVARAAVDVRRLDVADAVAQVPDGVLPVVTTTWALSRLRAERRRVFLARLEEVAARRPLAWVSVEGVGVAPSVPTLGDRPASGHSIIGVAVLEGSPASPEAVGRCWSRGRWVSWSAG
jgi:hypothetical protein